MAGLQRDRITYLTLQFEVAKHQAALSSVDRLVLTHSIHPNMRDEDKKQQQMVKICSMIAPKQDIADVWLPLQVVLLSLQWDSHMPDAAEHQLRKSTS